MTFSSVLIAGNNLLPLPPFVSPQAFRKFLPLFDRVLVERFTAETVTKGGIMLPEKSQGKMLQATVVAVGPGAVNQVTVCALSLVLHSNNTEINGNVGSVYDAKLLHGLVCFLRKENYKLLASRLEKKCSYQSTVERKSFSMTR